jgi:hypothetical protein
MKYYHYISVLHHFHHHLHQPNRYYHLNMCHTKDGPTIHDGRNINQSSGIMPRGNYMIMPNVPNHPILSLVNLIELIMHSFSVMEEATYGVWIVGLTQWLCCKFVLFCVVSCPCLVVFILCMVHYTNLTSYTIL